jgi:lysophospholipase L1-like esterase
MKRTWTGWTVALAAVFLLAAGFGCKETDSPTLPAADNPPVLTMLALGDSYTVGHAVHYSSCWPAQLADSLAAVGDTLQNLEIVAVTGWTTTDLLEGMGQRDLADSYGLVTVMIGVNNQFKGLDPWMFASELDSLLGWAGDLGEEVMVFTIPDYGATPMGQLFGPQVIADEIDAYNHILRDVAGHHDLVPLDVTTMSRDAIDEPALVARDDLHYSAEMYRRWVVMMLPEVRKALGQ